MDSAERIGKYTAGIDFEEFTKDTMRMDAVIRNFEVIGEAIKNLPPELSPLRNHLYQFIHISVSFIDPGEYHKQSTARSSDSDADRLIKHA